MAQLPDDLSQGPSSTLAPFLLPASNQLASFLVLSLLEQEQRPKLRAPLIQQPHAPFLGKHQWDANGPASLPLSLFSLFAFWPLGRSPSANRATARELASQLWLGALGSVTLEHRIPANCFSKQSDFPQGKSISREKRLELLTTKGEQDSPVARGHLPFSCAMITLLIGT